MRLCKGCQREIPKARLEALPNTQPCVRCSEAFGGEYDTVLVWGSLSKGSSLKKNWGGGCEDSFPMRSLRPNGTPSLWSENA